MGLSVRVIKNRLPEIRASLAETVDRAVRKAAFDIAAHAKDLAPVDTGALKNSIWVATSKDETYGSAIQAALARNPKAKAVSPPPAPALCAAYVGAGVHYAIYVEMGTRRMAARPFMRPAADAVEPGFKAAVKAVLKNL